LIGDQTLLTGLLAASAVMVAAIALVMMLRGLAARALEQRVESFTRPFADPGPDSDITPIGGIRRLLFWIGEMVRGRTRFYSERDIVALEGMIASAGFRPRGVLPILLGIKVVLAVAIPSAAILYAEAAGFPTSGKLLLTFIALPLALLGPEWIVTLLRRPYLAALRRGVPDALDLLVVCSEAGMGLDSALEHVSLEIAHSNPAMSMALNKLLDDMRVLPDRRDAFRNFAERTGVEGARRVSSMLAQSIRYGTPLSQALRAVALDLRRERMVALEAKAVRLPVLLTLPLILFIMPTLIIVLTGPAMLQLMDTLHAMGHAAGRH
jgi:tight adherence protein C